MYTHTHTSFLEMYTHTHTSFLEHTKYFAYSSVSVAYHWGEPISAKTHVDPRFLGIHSQTSPLDALSFSHALFLAQSLSLTRQPLPSHLGPVPSTTCFDLHTLHESYKNI